MRSSESTMKILVAVISGLFLVVAAILGSARIPDIIRVDGNVNLKYPEVTFGSTPVKEVAQEPQIAQLDNEKESPTKPPQSIQPQIESTLEARISTLEAQLQVTATDSPPTRITTSVTSDTNSIHVPEGSRVQVSGITASSTGGSFGPEILIDGNVGMDWFSSQGDEIGAWVDFRLSSRQLIHGIRVYQFCTKWPAASCIAKATLKFDDSSAQSISLDNLVGWQYRQFAPVSTESVRVWVDDVHQGNRDDLVMLNEIEFWGH